VGIDGPRDEITQWLMEEGDTSEQLKVVSIVGFGGLGKTTLANQVYREINSEFQCTTFVSVSRSPDIPKILKDMLSGLGHRNMDMADDINKLITALTKHLADKRYARSKKNVIVHLFGDMRLTYFRLLSLYLQFILV